MKNRTSESEFNNDLKNINIFQYFSHSKPEKPFNCVQYVFGTKKMLQVSTFEYPINLGLYQYFVNCKALVTKCSSMCLITLAVLLILNSRLKDQIKEFK